MAEEPDPDAVAAALLAGVSTLVRRTLQLPVDSGLTMPQRTALSQLERLGPTTSSALAREVQITAQAMGATLGVLRDRGFVERTPDPDDGRRMVLTVTEDGRQALRDKRNARAELIAGVLSSDAFTPAELERLAAAAPLIERLARRI
ncbi:MarR family transcriptional regulator [Streptomyces sp. SID8379]|uniref:MarR family winged helix-turn-helix transcriptional regulator n=1 Tax=unclassified Streptomyces TaxID=2593676 RepID=UPI00037C0F47|nr:MULTISPECIES: MarR family transcriptional regulator [unclassified Streptomyces]MYW64056.1 MarR family transcriptional regulator [Streptomyces sp. SID8379]